MNATINSATAFNCEVTLVDGSANQGATAHCLANGSDLGRGTMDPYATFSFVTPVVENQRTIMTCDITLGNLHGRFDLFDSNADAQRCALRALDWRIDENGLFILIDHVFVQRYRWT
ncbi:hypothetical protein C2S51_020960 [Perilla frutescens var. frutescens]|nr:hypothetical protein C2S51_020960 [Perilla frutescens var. frutescens]